MTRKKMTRDPWVLVIQEWLNETYGNITGFGSVAKDRATSWATVYG